MYQEPEILRPRSSREKRKSMPDIASESVKGLTGSLDRVGMSHIEMPIQLQLEGGKIAHCPARIEAFVSLDNPTAKGIHMSRIFLQLQEIFSERVFGFETLELILKQFIQSHEGISQSSSIRVSFDYMIQRPSLKSAYKGWRQYPVYFASSLKENTFKHEMGVEVLYSSTCPCSAALARQLIQEQFLKDFPTEEITHASVYKWLGSEEGIVATPHSQRSRAEVRLRMEKGEKPSLVEIIDLIEKTLATPVQAVVKREDEQEFALLNGQNLMFCEDAGRRVQNALKADPRISDYWAKLEHIESLHPHDAVSIVTKGVPGGFRAD